MRFFLNIFRTASVFFSIFVLLFISIESVSAATSSSYQLQAAPRHTQSATSNSYQSCSQMVEFGVYGSSNSYSVVPALNCDVPQVVTPGGGGRTRYCGNGLIESINNEQCDDGNLINGDGCSAVCTLELPDGGGPVPPTEPEEPVISVCGNGVREEGEQCDDGNGDNQDSCTNSCVLNLIPPTTDGDDFEKPDEPVEPGEEPFPTLPEEPEVPSPEAPTPDEPVEVTPEYPDYGAALLRVCGNGIRETGEQCDDGNLRNNDGCSAACFLETVPLPEEGKEVPARIFGKGDEYLTNDVSTLFFELFDQGSGDYEIIVTTQAGRQVKLEVVKTSEGYFSLHLLEDLPDGWYQVQVNDRQQPKRQEFMMLEVRSDEPIEASRLVSIDGQKVPDDQESFEVLSDRPLIVGQTELSATIAIASHALDQVFIVFTDLNGAWEFEYPGFDAEVKSDRLEIVAMYEDGRVSRERVLNIERVSAHASTDAGFSASHLLLMVLMLFVLSSIVLICWTKAQDDDQLYQTVRDHLLLMVGSRTTRFRIARRVVFVIVLIGMLFFMAINAFAVTTTPNLIPYEGILRDNTATPITVSQDFRFSFWLDSDFIAGVDRDGSGAIPGAAPGFSGYSEVQSVTPDAAGFFQVNIGAVSGTIPDFITTTHLYLQVEVKPTGSPDTAYETLDIDGIDNADDRQALGTLPYARNADFIDNAELGTSAGNIATLGAGDVFPTTFIPGGTDANDFLIDANDDAPGVTRLSFGALLNNQILQFDPDGVAIGDGWFDFTDDVNIQGDLTVVGTVNGQTLGPRNRSLQFQPLFPDTVPVGDGSDNKGKLEIFFEDTDGAAAPDNFNYYQWTTKQNTLQDFDIVMRVRLPDDFNAFQAVPMNLRYRTANNVLTDNRIDVEVQDSTGTTVPGMTGNTALNTAGVFASTDITFGGGTFTPGTEMTIIIKVTARTGFFADVSDLNINFIAL